MLVSFNHNYWQEALPLPSSSISNQKWSSWIDDRFKSWDFCCSFSRHFIFIPEKLSITSVVTYSYIICFQRLFTKGNYSCSKTSKWIFVCKFYQIFEATVSTTGCFHHHQFRYWNGSIKMSTLTIVLVSSNQI